MQRSHRLEHLEDQEHLVALGMNEEVSMSVFTNPATGAAEHAAAYVSAVLELLGNLEPNAVLREMPSALPDAIEGLSKKQLRQPERPGKWSIGQILQHLADSEIVWAWRMRLILAQDRPRLTGYDQDLWAERLDYAEADPSDALELFAVLRRANLRLVERASPADLKRVGLHVERGEETLEHLRQAVRRARSAAPPSNRACPRRSRLTHATFVPGRPVHVRKLIRVSPGLEEGSIARKSQTHPNSDTLGTRCWSRLELSSRFLGV